MIDSEYKRALLVLALSRRTIKVLEVSCAPNTVNKLSYEELVKALGYDILPTCSEIDEQFKFYKKHQEEGETAQLLLVEL